LGWLKEQGGTGRRALEESGNRDFGHVANGWGLHSSLTNCSYGRRRPRRGTSWWLTMAEVELNIFARSCLSRPVGALATLHRQVDALERERNAACCTLQWWFTSQQARTKLADLYPVNET
jgi:hypothetical protein